MNATLRQGGVGIREVQQAHRRVAECEAETVGRRTGLGARAPRPDLEEADLVHPGDAAAAGADLDQLDRRDADRQAAALHEALLARRLEAVGRQRLAFVDERELGRGAAHVEGQHPAIAVGAAEEGAGAEVAAIKTEVILSFLGLGVQPPTPSWGLMVSEGKDYMLFEPYLVMLPGLAIFVLVLAINLLGDGARDIFAPENRN